MKKEWRSCMFLSVSMPVYNAEKTLDQCIQSVIDQTEKDYEIILVDDGSSDRSLEICEKWATLYPDIIRVVKKENSGSLFTRRVCLKESKGEYLYVMDSDDYLIDKNAFMYIRKIIERVKCDLVFFDCTTNVETFESYFKIPFKDGTVFEGEYLKEFRKFFIVGHGLNSLWNKVFHRSLVDWDEDYSSYNKVTNGTDRFQSLPIVSNAKKVYYFDKILYYYRMNNNETSIIHTFKKTGYYSSRMNFIRVSKEASKWGFDKKELYSLLSQSYMKIASTAAYKTRLIKSEEIDRVEYLKKIGNDVLFRKFYNFSNAKSFSRKMIVFLLHIRAYAFLLFAIDLSRKIKLGT